MVTDIVYKQTSTVLFLGIYFVPERKKEVKVACQHLTKWYSSVILSVCPPLSLSLPLPPSLSLSLTAFH